MNGRKILGYQLKAFKTVRQVLEHKNRSSESHLLGIAKNINLLLHFFLKAETTGTLLISKVGKTVTIRFFL